jgi:hypothetical protein
MNCFVFVCVWGVWGVVCGVREACTSHVALALTIAPLWLTTDDCVVFALVVWLRVPQVHCAHWRRCGGGVCAGPIAGGRWAGCAPSTPLIWSSGVGGPWASSPSPPPL